MIKIVNIIFIIILFTVIFFTSFFDSKISIAGKKILLLIFTIILTLFLGFRDIGLDLEVYREIFNNQRIISINELVSNGIFNSSLEPFFVVLISILKDNGLGFNWFLLISGGIPLLIIFSVIRKKEEKHMLFTFLLFLLLHFIRGPVDIIRHFFAATIYLSAIYSLYQKEKIKFWIKSFSSVLIHFSNISILLFKPILTVNWSKRKYIGSIFMVFIFGFITKFIIKGLELIEIGTINNPLIWKFVYYLTYYNVEGYKYAGIPHKVLLSIMDYFPLILNIAVNFIILNKIKIIEKDGFYKILLSSQIIGSLIGIFFIIINAPTLGLRLNFLFGIGNFFLIKEILFNSYRNKNHTTLFVLLMTILVFYNFVVVLYFAGIHDPMSPFYLF